MSSDITKFQTRRDTRDNVLQPFIFKTKSILLPFSSYELNILKSQNYLLYLAFCVKSLSALLVTHDFCWFIYKEA